MILQNGKRIDGCSDTVPIGTLQPYLGLVPPKGYLVCQGQLVSKITYSKLYEICGDTFGTSTETHFYLPDLRGKTLAGYDESDTAMNTIGKLLGQKTHVHTTGNHTLTVDEMPQHNHHFEVEEGDRAAYATSDRLYLSGSAYPDLPTAGIGGDWYSSGTVKIQLAGDSQPHNHGDTGSNTNYQPTITVNWIVKAVMLIPDYIIVEDTLNSDNAVDALSARQGKILNEKFADYATKSEMIQYLPLKGGTLTGPITMPDSCYYVLNSYGLDMNNSDIIGANAIYFNDECGADEGLMFKRSNGNWDALRAINGGLYLNVNRTRDMSDSGTLVQIATREDIEGTVVFNGQGNANWLSQDTTYSFDVSQYKYLLVHFTSWGVNNPTDRYGGNAVNQVVHIDLTTPSDYPICNVDGVYYRYGGTETHLDMQFLFGNNGDPGLFFSGIFVSEDKKKIYVGNAGYVVLGTTEPTVQWGSLYNGVSRIVGFK